MANVRLTRRLDSGLLKIKDRKVDEDGKEEIVFHVIGAEYSPVVALKQRTEKKIVEGKQVSVNIPGAFIAIRNDKGGHLFSKPGKEFAVMDLDFVMKNHGSILEKV